MTGDWLKPEPRSVPSRAPSFLRPAPSLPREKVEACIEHFECMNVNITVKPNVMFEINFCTARLAISPGKHSHHLFPPIVLCLRYSLLDCVDLYTMYFSCVFVKLYSPIGKCIHLYDETQGNSETSAFDRKLSSSGARK